MKAIFLILGIISGVTGLIIFANSDNLSTSEQIEQNERYKTLERGAREAELLYGIKVARFDRDAENRKRAAEKEKTAIIFGGVSALLLVVSIAIPKSAASPDSAPQK